VENYSIIPERSCFVKVYERFMKEEMLTYLFFCLNIQETSAKHGSDAESEGHEGSKPMRWRVTWRQQR